MTASKVFYLVLQALLLSSFLVCISAEDDKHDVPFDKQDGIGGDFLAGKNIGDSEVISKDDKKKEPVVKSMKKTELMNILNENREKIQQDVIKGMSQLQKMNALTVIDHGITRAERFPDVIPRKKLTKFSGRLFFDLSRSLRGVRHALKWVAIAVAVILGIVPYWIIQLIYYIFGEPLPRALIGN